MSLSVNIWGINNSTCIIFLFKTLNRLCHVQNNAWPPVVLRTSNEKLMILQDSTADFTMILISCPNKNPCSIAMIVKQGS